MKKLFVAVVLLSLVSLVVLPLGVSAQPPDTLPTGINTPEKLIELIDLITNWIFTLFLLLAVIFIVIGALQFVTAGGKPESVSEARQKIIYAAIGIIVALIAKAIPAVLKNIVGGIGS